jgi:hypothetical protein
MDKLTVTTGRMQDSPLWPRIETKLKACRVKEDAVATPAK